MRHALPLAVAAALLGSCGSGQSPSPVTPPHAAPRFAGLGTLVPGVKLRATTGKWRNSPTSYSYQWERCSNAGTECVVIVGASSQTYTITEADEGHDLTVTVTASNSHGSGKQSAVPVGPVEASCTGSCIYVSQSGAGAETGSSCTAAHPLSWVSEEGSWSHTAETAGKISPNTTVMLCGTLTAAIGPPGGYGGEAGKPVTFKFRPGAKWAVPGNGCPSTGCMNMFDLKYLAITGGTIENTERSYAKEKEEGPETVAVRIEACQHCTIERMTIGPLYIAEKGNVVGNTSIIGVKERPNGVTPEYITVSHDTFTNLGWAVNIENAPTSNHINVEYDTFEHLTHGFTPGAESAGGSIGPVVFAHNTFSKNLNWEDGETDTNHVDMVHCFASVGPHYNGLYIYDNYAVVEGANITSGVFLEGGTGGGATKCGDATSKLWAFNNVLRSTHQIGNGTLSMDSGEPRAYNNTLIGPETSEGTCMVSNSAATNIRAENDLLTTCHTLLSTEASLLGTLDYNLYANGGTEAWGECGGTHYAFTNLAGWRSCTSQDGHSKAEATAKISLSEEPGVMGKPEAGSPALGAGTNLTSLCPETPEEALCTNILGEARPSTGAWNIGAY